MDSTALSHSSSVAQSDSNLHGTAGLACTPPDVPPSNQQKTDEQDAARTTRFARIEDMMRSFGRQIAGQDSLYMDRSGTTFQMMTLLISIAVITFCGLVFHLAHPDAAHDRQIDQASPPPPPHPPPLLPMMDAPPAAPLLPAANPIGEWWRRRRSISEMVASAWIQLALCVIFCCFVPVLVIHFRRASVRRQRSIGVIRRMLNSRSLRHTRLREAARPRTPAGRWRSGASRVHLASAVQHQSSQGIEIGDRV